MKKRFLPFSLLLVIMVLGQSLMADQGGHYVPREKDSDNAEAYIASMRVNQLTGLIDPAWMIKSEKQTEMAINAKDETPVYWVSMGPDNFGGRTTSIVYNNANPNEVYIGSMGGGVFYTWNQGVTWHQVGENLMVSCMAQADDGTIYVGTGDGNSAHSYNLLGDLGFTNSFLGSGLYKIKDNVMEPVPGTQPSTQNGVSEWCYINAIAIDGDMIILATDDGLRYSTDGCATWQFAVCNDVELTERADEVFIAPDHDIVASVKGMLYVGPIDNLVCHSAANDVLNEDGVITMIAASPYVLDVAVSPKNANVMYAATFNVNGDHSTIYTTEDKGQTWHVALPSVTSSYGHQVYEGRALFNHGLVIDPENTDWLYICGYNLWRLERTASDPYGYYIAMKLSDGNETPMYGGTNRYLHVGVNWIAFDPRDAKKAYVATDGGIFKAYDEPNSIYLDFTNCNRGYVSTRALNVGVSGKAERVVGGFLDHGPVLIEGDENADHMSTGVTMLPYATPSSFGLFEETYHAGTCLVSTINPNAIIFSSKNGNLKRTETSGQDYDISNFTSNQSFTSFSGYCLPMTLFENYEDDVNLDSVWYYGKDGDKAGDVVQCFSNNNGYPFDFVLPYNMTSEDSIQVHDPITAKLYVGISNALYVTREPIRFNVVPDWYKISDRKAGFNGVPTCLALSSDGDVIFAGMRAGKLVRVSNLNSAIDAATSTSNNASFAIETAALDLPTSRQVVTSVSVDPNNANNVLVTLGNYGNEQYVLYSTNALAEEPEFISVQGNLPLMPVFSSVIVMQNGYVMVGTERGVWMTKNIQAANVEWVAVQDNMGVVPVMDLKQQTFYHESQYVETMIDSVIYVTEFPGIRNQGAIYAATYGKGLFRCENYLMHVGESVGEVAAQAPTVSMYPNPVRDLAKVSFNLNESARVSYQVFDMMGRMVKSETVGTFANGKHEVEVGMEGLASGAYVLRLNAGSTVSTVKFLVY